MSYLEYFTALLQSALTSLSTENAYVTLFTLLEGVIIQLQGVHSRCLVFAIHTLLFPSFNHIFERNRIRD